MGRRGRSRWRGRPAAARRSAPPGRRRRGRSESRTTSGASQPVLDPQRRAPRSAPTGEAAAQGPVAGHRALPRRRSAATSTGSCSTDDGLLEVRAGAAGQRLRRRGRPASACRWRSALGHGGASSSRARVSIDGQRGAARSASASCAARSTSPRWWPGVRASGHVGVVLQPGADVAAMKTAIAFIGSWKAPMPAAAHTVPAGERRDQVGEVAGRRRRVLESRAAGSRKRARDQALVEQLVREVRHAGVEELELRPDARVAHALGSARIVSGALTLAVSRKFSEPSVRLAMSGFASPSSAGRRRAVELGERRGRSSSHTRRRRGSAPQLGDERLIGLAPPLRAPSASRAWRCRIVAPACKAGLAVGDDLLGRHRDVRHAARCGTIPSAPRCARVPAAAHDQRRHHVGGGG